MLSTKKKSGKSKNGERMAVNSVEGIKADAGTYARNHKFLTELREMMRNGRISRHEMLAFRGRALSGDADGAQKGLARLLRDRYMQ